MDCSCPVNDPLVRTNIHQRTETIVIGVFEKVGESLVGQSYDKMVLVPFKFVRTVVNTDKNDGNLIMVSAKEGVALGQLKDELTGIMRSIRRFVPVQTIILR